MVDLAGFIVTAWSENTRQEKARGASRPRTHCWASGWHPCRRKMCLDLTHPENIVYEGDVLESFAAGDAFERDARARLVQAGRIADPPFELVRDQEYVEIYDRSGRKVIAGKTDGVIVFRGGFTHVLEIKGGNSVEGIACLEDFAASKYARGYPYQLAAYMLGQEIRYGLFVLKQRRGAPNFVSLDLEDDRVLEMAEDFIERATEAADYAEAAEVIEDPGLPDFTDQPGLCRRCPHRGKSCAPPVHFGGGLQVVRDQTLVAFAADVAENAEGAAKHARGKRALGEALRPDVEIEPGEEPHEILVALGDYELRGKLSPRKGSPNGAFSFEVVKTGGAS